MLTDPPDLLELVFVTFSFLADTAFLVRSFHIIDSCPYGLYNMLDEASKEKKLVFFRAANSIWRLHIA